MSSTEFIHALETGDLEVLRRIPKTDFHNHGSLGFPLHRLKSQTGIDIPDPPFVMPTFEEFALYLKTHLQALIYSREGFIMSVWETLNTAQSDAVTELEISIDCQIVPEFESAEEIVDELKKLSAQFPGVAFRPEVGINREWDKARRAEWVWPLINTGYFAAIDLYGNEIFGEPEEFVEDYALARSLGMRLKAHAGEYRDADFVWRSAEVLELDEVQHGISAASSPDLMRWLADHSIRLNICPTSNLRLARIPQMSAHPVRSLYDAGVQVTINTDDLLVFDQTASEEYLNLYRAGVLTAAELDQIRMRSFR